MKALIALGLFAAFSVSSVKAQSHELDMDCLAKVVTAVNTKHTLAEGAVYALRTLFTGQYASAVLVGHSDETDPTDYLVSVEQGCKIKSIVYANDAGDVVNYTHDETELVDKVYAKIDQTLTAKAIELIQELPASGYDTRTLCIVGNRVTGIIPATHWSANDRKIVTGRLKSFPAKIRDGKSPIEISGSSRELVSGTEHNGFYKVRGYVDDKAANVCLIEQKALLESVH